MFCLIAGSFKDIHREFLEKLGKTATSVDMFSPANCVCDFFRK